MTARHRRQSPAVPPAPSAAPATPGDARLDVHVRKVRSARGSAAFQLDAAFSATTGVTVIVGPSGAGKTTLLRCIAGLTEPDEGRVTVGDRVLLDTGDRVRVEPARRRVAFVVQDLALFPHLSVQGNVTYGLRRLDRHQRERRMREILESFQISHLRDRSPRDISGGEQQRVALARALVTEPSVLLLDEPLSSLDPATKVRILEDLQRWNDTRRIPILYVTHDEGELLAMGDRVIVLDQGRIVEQGMPSEVARTPARAAAAHRAGFENVFDATVVERRDAEGTMTCRLTGTEISLVTRAAPVPVGAEVCLGVRAGDILVSSSRPTMLTASNVVPGTIRQLEHKGAVVEARVAGGAELWVRMDARTAESGGSGLSADVWMMFGADACHLVRPVPLDALRRLFVFVCQGNTIRSPMAQAICNAEIAGRFGVPQDSLDRLGIKAVSAGLAARPGAPLADDAGRALAVIGAPVADHRAYNLTHRLAEHAEAIFCMTERQRSDLVAAFPAVEPKAHRLHPDTDVDDPHDLAYEGVLACAVELQELIRQRLTSLGISGPPTP